MNLLYQFELKKVLVVSVLLVIAAFVGVKSTYADSLASASAMVTTSRPSASSPLAKDALITDGAIQVADNGSRFLASDSAKIIRTSTSAWIDQNIIIASQSGDLTIINLASTMASNAQKGVDVLINPITAMHTITFTVKGTIPVGGSIVLTYPGAINTASPSATVFSFNGLTSSNVKMYNSGGVTCGAITISAPTITCSNISAKIDAIVNPTVTFYLGCVTMGPAGACATQAPTLINPTKRSVAGTADTWRVYVNTYNSPAFGSVPIDDTKLLIGTIESVTVRATVDPTLTFIIAGIPNGTLLSTLNVGCGQADTTNAGIDSTETEVNLGVIGANPNTNDTVMPNIAAQSLTVTTNAPNGYSIVATSSGHLVNPSTGYYFHDENIPRAFPNNQSNYFGLHACGLDSDATFWTSSGNDACNTYRQGSTNPVCYYAWPTQTTPVLISNRSLGPVGNTLTPGSGQTIVSYAAAQDPSLIPGQYRTVVTYMATPSF